MAAAAILKNKKSRYLGNGLTDRHEIGHSDAIRQFWRFPRLEICNYIIQDGGGRLFQHSKNRLISAAISAISTKFGSVTQFDPLDLSGRYKWEIFIVEDGRHPEKSKNCHISATVWPIGKTFGMMTNRTSS